MELTTPILKIFGGKAWVNFGGSEAGSMRAWLDTRGIKMASKTEPQIIKEEGNEFFKNKDYHKAAECYTRALSLSINQEESLVYYKNRAACHIKLSNFTQAIKDTQAGLQINPSDTKCLYRYAQGLEGEGKEAESLIQLKKLITIDPKNREANEMARRLIISLKKTSEHFQSTDSVVGEMFKRLSDISSPLSQRIQAAKNLAILSREEGGANKIHSSNCHVHLIPYLSEDSPELVNHILQIFVGLVTGNKIRSESVFDTLKLDIISDIISSTHTNLGASCVLLLKEIVLSSTLPPPEKSKTPRSHGNGTQDMPPLSPLVVPIVQLCFLLFESIKVSRETRDILTEFFVKTIPREHMPREYLNRELVKVILRVASQTWEDMDRDKEEEEEEGGEREMLPVSDECRMNLSMILSVLHNNIQGREDKTLQDLFSEQCRSYFTDLMSSSDLTIHLSLLSALSCLLQAIPKIGNEIFSEDSILSLSIKMSESPEITCQVVAAEAIALAASDSTRCQGIMSKGLSALKTLYHSPDERVQVRALVGLCKLGTSSGGYVNNRPFAEGATVKLEKTCRKFLVSAKKGDALKKWAAEGIAFLSLDAEVKEAMIQDGPALKVLFDLVKSPDKSLLYGIVSTLVNLTNSYDKPERNPELEELGKFAGENVPKEHEFDGQDFVDKRVDVLLKVGVVPVLSELATSLSSVAMREQVSRVFLALVGVVGNRGNVVQQGGVKTLVSLSLEGNTEKGKLIASQSLAKIGITSDPRLSFPGQRSLEVVRPFVQLLKSRDNGLQQFEGLMALTNLASTTDDVRSRVLREGAVPLAEGLMFEEEPLIRRAATEFICNMIQEDQVVDRFHGDDVERVKLWTLFSGEEDEALVRAASGGLAQLSHDPKICHKIMEVKSAKEIFKELLTKDNKELVFRGLYIVANLMSANKEIAQDLISDEFLEICMAYLQGDYPDNIKGQAERSLEQAVKYGLIKPNPELLGEEEKNGEKKQ